MHVECKCGIVALTVPESSPRLTLADGCRSCRETLLRTRGELASQSMIVNPLPELLTHIYVSDDITVSKGRDRMRAVTLQAEPSGGAVRIVTDCCGSALLAWHPLYQGKVISVLTNTCRVEDWEDGGLDGVDGIVWLVGPDMVHEGQPGAAEEVVRLWGGDDELVVYGDEDGEEMFKKLANLVELMGPGIDRKDIQGCSFEDLLATLPKGVEKLQDVLPLAVCSDATGRQAREELE